MVVFNHRSSIQDATSRGMGRWNRVARFPPPLLGLAFLIAVNRWLAAPANFQLSLRDTFELHSTMPENPVMHQSA